MACAKYPLIAACGPLGPASPQQHPRKGRHSEQGPYLEARTLSAVDAWAQLLHAKGDLAEASCLF